MHITITTVSLYIQIYIYAPVAFSEKSGRNSDYRYSDMKAYIYILI